MPLHPSAPEELTDLVEAYRQAMRSFMDLARSCPDAKIDAETVCLGWSVKDHVAHVASLEAYFDGGDYPEVELPQTDHLKSTFTTWIEHGVRARTDHTMEQLLEELETATFNRLATLSNPELTVATMVHGPMDREVTLADLMQRRLVDIWVHEQDIREALGRIGNLDSAAASTFVARIVDAFPRILTRRLDLPAGQTVILESSGPVTARVGVRMARGSDGEIVGNALFTGSQETAAEDAADQVEHPEEDVVTTSISMSTDALTRRAAGRRSTEDSLYKVVGDEETARLVLDALVITP